MKNKAKKCSERGPRFPTNVPGKIQRSMLKGFHLRRFFQRRLWKGLLFHDSS